MRRYLQNNILRVVQTMYEAHAAISEMLGTSDGDVRTMLCDLQNTAIELGNALEESEGESNVNFEPLESYCETVYNVAEGEYTQADKEAVKTLLDGALSKFEKYMEEDVHIISEIVFMPYNASMWDSLESVWEAADKDENCHAYVVPIPYYDKNADGTLGDMHYDGSLLPNDVPVIHYDDIDLEALHPDVIFIHNPYDGANHATSVDPRFYSKELKRYTDDLVYIPYCVYPEPQGAITQEWIDRCEHYLTPVMLHADHIIFQSEKFAELFLEVAEKKFGLQRAFFERKILALGSPKYDSVKKIVDPDSIPREWRNRIDNGNGERRKIIFYNTSLVMMLKHKGDMVRKIRSVISFFGEHREEYLLIWRPHPLIETTIRSMLPDLWEEYRQIVREYKKSGIGIYDDTSDYHTAFLLSDAYYGDSSSLVHLYRETGKPVLMQNPSVIDYCEPTGSLLSWNMYYDGTYIWATALYCNALYKIDPVSFRAEYVGAFPGEDMNGYHLFRSITAKDNCLYFEPAFAKSVGIFNKETGEFDSIGLEELGNEEISRLIRGACALNGKLYSIDAANKSMLEYDPKNETVRSIGFHDEQIDTEKLSTARLLSDGRRLFLLQPYAQYILELSPHACSVIGIIDCGLEAYASFSGDCMTIYSFRKPGIRRVNLSTHESKFINTELPIAYAISGPGYLICRIHYQRQYYILDINTLRLETSEISLGEQPQVPYEFSKMRESSIAVRGDNESEVNNLYSFCKAISIRNNVSLKSDNVGYLIFNTIIGKAAH